ncbi:MAG: hypothetical protein ACLP9L_36920 [Thermoguttaceae bacterium]
MEIVRLLLDAGEDPNRYSYDRCAHTFMSAICIAATVIFSL